MNLIVFKSAVKRKQAKRKLLTIVEFLLIFMV